MRPSPSPITWHFWVRLRSLVAVLTPVFALWCASCADTGTETPAGPITRDFATYAAPALSYYCNGCHTDPAGTGNCYGLKCFGDNPCVMAEPGCCTAERPFMSCAVRAQLGDQAPPQTLTVGECAVLRFDLTLAIATSGTVKDVYPDDQKPAGTAATGFAKIDLPSTFGADLARLHEWSDYGYALPDMCQEPVAPR